MANLLPLVVSTVGNTQRLQSGDTLVIQSGIDVNAAGAMVVGATNATSIIISHAGITTTIAGSLDIPSGVNLSLSSVACNAGVTADNLNTLTDGYTSDASALHMHTTWVEGLITSGVGDGYFGYISAANTLSLTDADSETSSRVFGASEGVDEYAITAGIVENAIFTATGGEPGNGDPVYLASASEEAGADGKLTATAPDGQVSGAGAGNFCAEVGICVDNTDYAGSKTCKILLQPKLVLAV